jgi:hypothetical protein
VTTPFPPFVTGLAVVHTTLGLAEGDALLLAVTALGDGEGDGDLLALGDGEGDALVVELGDGDADAVDVSAPPPKPPPPPPPPKPPPPLPDVDEEEGDAVGVAVADAVGVAVADAVGVAVGEAPPSSALVIVTSSDAVETLPVVLIAVRAVTVNIAPAS